VLDTVSPSFNHSLRPIFQVHIVSVLLKESRSFSIRAECSETGESALHGYQTAKPHIAEGGYSRLGKVTV
jgi:hypothetical protein